MTKTKIRPRAVAYIRESTEEQGATWAPETQRAAIRKFAESAGLMLVDEYLDLHSAWRDEAARPNFRRMIGDAAAHKFEVILVYDWSRFARSMEASRRNKGMLRKGGIDVFSVTQPSGNADDPTTFMTEGVWELFDEHYSVKLSFTIKGALATKRDAGHLVGGLGWGYVRNAKTQVAEPDAIKAPFVEDLFRKYATGKYSYLDLAEWLNAKGLRTTKGNTFAAASVREILCNLAYAGWVGGLREQERDRCVRGCHQPIVSDELFDKVAAIRLGRTRTLNPGRPSVGYALSKLAYCELCGAKLHGGTSGNPGSRRRTMRCANRIQRRSCRQAPANAEHLEDQLAAFVVAADPVLADKKAVIKELKKHERERSGAEEAERKTRELTRRLKRIKQLFEMDDLTLEEYRLKRDTLRSELDECAPPVEFNVEAAASAFLNFRLFWEKETDPSQRNELLRRMFVRVWVNDGAVCAVEPQPEFMRYFKLHTRHGAGAECEARERRGSAPRARVRDDIEALADLVPALKVEETPEHDYPFRASVTREAWASAAAALAQEIDYPNFKNAGAERQGVDREHVYGDVWAMLFQLQRPR